MFQFTTSYGLRTASHIRVKPSGASALSINDRSCAYLNSRDQYNYWCRSNSLPPGFITVPLKQRLIQWGSGNLLTCQKENAKETGSPVSDIAVNQGPWSHVNQPFPNFHVWTMNKAIPVTHVQHSPQGHPRSSAVSRRLAGSGAMTQAANGDLSMSSRKSREFGTDCIDGFRILSDMFHSV